MVVNNDVMNNKDVSLLDDVMKEFLFQFIKQEPTVYLPERRYNASRFHGDDSVDGDTEPPIIQGDVCHFMNSTRSDRTNAWI